MAAYLETPAASRRRRAFLAALTPMVGRDAALEAIDLWENAFGSDQPLWRGLSQFSTLAIQEFNWHIKAEDLALRLVEHLQLAEHMLPPDPGAPRYGMLNGIASLPEAEPEPLSSPALTATAESVMARPNSVATAKSVMSPPPVAVATNLSAPTRTLAALLTCMHDAARACDARLDQEVVSSFVTAARRQLPRDIAQDLEALVTGASRELAHDYTKSRAVAVINLFYVALARSHGPIATDRMLTSSVRAVEALPVSHTCAPRDLL